MSRKIKTVQGDTWDILAKRIWGDEKLMNRLLEHNQTHRYRAIFPSGVTIVVPDIEIAPSSSPPPWRAS